MPMRLCFQTDVRFGSLTVIGFGAQNVRFVPLADIGLNPRVAEKPH